MGIAKEKQKLLFNKFSQVQTPGSHVGTGLGLYIVKGIIEAHGGAISLQSELGHGTSISFTLPLGALTSTPQPYEPVSLHKAVN